MRPTWLFPLLFAFACTRTFVSPAAVAEGPPAIASIAFASGGALPSTLAVASGDTLVAQGSNLTGVSSITVGGQAAPLVSGTSTSIEFTVPEVGGDQVGQPVPLLLVRGNLPFTANQQLRVYGLPRIDQILPLISEDLERDAVVSPGLMVISGQNFSPSIGENQVTVGGRPAVVISANPDELLVTLDSLAETGNTQCSVSVVPSGSPDRGLVGTHHAYVWEVVSQVWFWPRHVVGRQTTEGIRNGLFPAEAVGQLDQFGLTQLADSTLASPQAWAVMNYFPNAATAPIVIDGGGQSTSGGSGSTTGDQLGGCAIGGTGGTGSAPADSNLGIFVDGAAVAATQVGYADAGTSGTHWRFVPEPEQPGVHKIQLNDPAGLSSTDQVTWLQGHLSAPGMTCYPSPIDWTRGAVSGLAPTTLLSTDTVGGAVGFVEVDAGAVVAISTVRFDPGGATEAPAMAPLIFSADSYHLLNAGRHLLYLAPDQPGDGGTEFSALSLDTGLQEQFISLDAGAGLFPVAVREPTLDDSNLWVALSGGPSSSFEVALVALPVQADAGPSVVGIVSQVSDSLGDHPCVGAARLVATRWTDTELQLAVDCVTDTGASILAFGVLPTPDVSAGSAASNLLVPTWTTSAFLGPDGAAASPKEPWRAKLTDTSVAVLAPDGAGADLFMSPLSSVANECNPGIAFQDPNIEAAAPSPDGTQVVGIIRQAPGSADVRIYEAPGADAGMSWNWSAYPLPPGTAATAVTFDNSGSQVIIATVADPLLGPDAGPAAPSGYCVLR